jgi:hypothetical protein
MTKAIAGIGTPPQRRYWKGHDQKADELLAEELFIGRRISSASGRAKTEFPAQNGSRERLAREALARLLSYYAGENGLEILALLCSALMNDGGTDRRIAFQFRKKGKRGDKAADYQVGLTVLSLVKDDGVGVDAAVKYAEQIFELSPQAVYRAVKRVKQRLRSFGLVDI